MNPKDYADMEQIEQNLADQMGVSLLDVRARIEEIIRLSFSSSDPETQAACAAIPREGELPTPEEFLLYYVHMAEGILDATRQNGMLS